MVKKVLYGVAAILLIVLLFQVFDLYRFNGERDRIVEEKAQQTMDTLKAQVDDILAKIVKEGERLATEFGANEYTQQEIEKLIKESSLSIPELQGITACYEPNAFSEDKRLFCPYYNKGTDDYVFVEDTYDYTDEAREGNAWYTNVRKNGAKWVEPYFADAAKDWYIDFGIPFHYSTGPKKGQVRGTITMSFVTSGFKQVVLSLSLGKTGYGIITSNEGNFLSHPINDYIGTTNLKTIQQKEKNPDLARAYDDILNGKSGNISFRQNDDDGESLFVYDKIPTSDWGIGLMFQKTEMLGDTTAQNQRYIRISLLLSAFLLIIIAIYFNKDHLDFTEIWQLSLLATVFLIANIFFIWYLEHTGTRSDASKNPPIADVGNLNDFVAQQHLRSDRLKLPKSVPVPTGIFVQRMAFENSYNLNVGGTIWQKYPLSVADKVNIGFRFPQTSPFAEASFIEEIYRKRVPALGNRAGHLLVGYDFRVTLQEYLDYQNFPFDKRHISIDIVPISNEDRLLFTPDLAAYEYTNPGRRPGLNKNVKISGNLISRSYFNYSVKSFDTNFGYPSKTLFEQVPVMQYNIDVKRILVNVFVTYLIPIFVTLIMVFILLIACSKTDERQGIIEGMAAFIFVLIFSHIDMRREIITADLIFLEYFYFITYLIILLSTWNLITYAKNKASFFDFNDNQIYKASYFPFFFLCILIVTLSKFY